MKKLFTLAAIALSALAVHAATVTVTYSVGGNKDANVGPLTITATDPDGKMAIDANNCYFGDATAQVKFESRLKSGGKSSSSKNFLTIKATNAGTLKIYARTGSSSDETRNIVVKEGSTELLNQILKDADAIDVTMEGEEAAQKVFPVYSVNLEANKDYVLSYPVGSVNFYGFVYDYTGKEPDPKAANPALSVAGGQYYDPFYLKITSSNADHIYYSLNGAAYAEYTDSILVNDYTKKTTISAYATKADALNSDTIKAEYELKHFVARPVFNARETMSLGGVKAEDITIPSNNGTKVTYTMDGHDCPAITYNHLNLPDGGDSTMTVKLATCPNLTILYKNGDNKANVLKFADNYVQFDSKNCIMYIDSVHSGDTIVIVATSKGSTPTKFDHTYSTACYLDPYQPEDDTDPCFTDGDVYTTSDARIDEDFIGWTNLVYIVQAGEDGKDHTRVRIKEINGGARVAKIQIGAYRGEKTALSNPDAAVKAQKLVENGQIVILKNGVRYNVLGAKL